MKNNLEFTFLNIENQYKSALEAGYKFLTCNEYAENKEKIKGLTIVNRVDIDISVKKADRLREIFEKIGIKASFFVRLHASEYNPFSFENYRILKAIRDDGHEIGYHSEIIDQAAIWGEEAEECLIRDIEILEKMFNIKIKGVASHGGMTGLNNLDFWKNRSAAEYGLNYEAYDNNKFNLFNNSFYISDSEWVRWKCYKNGVLCVGDNRSLIDHISYKYDLIYLLIHPETYYDKHCYE